MSVCDTLLLVLHSRQQPLQPHQRKRAASMCVRIYPASSFFLSLSLSLLESRRANSGQIRTVSGNKLLYAAGAPLSMSIRSSSDRDRKFISRNIHISSESPMAFPWCLARFWLTVNRRFLSGLILCPEKLPVERPVRRDSELSDAPNVP